MDLLWIRPQLLDLVYINNNALPSFCTRVGEYGAFESTVVFQ